MYTSYWMLCDSWCLIWSCVLAANEFYWLKWIVLGVDRRSTRRSISRVVENTDLVLILCTNMMCYVDVRVCERGDNILSTSRDSNSGHVFSNESAIAISSVWCFGVALHIEIYMAPCGFHAMARLLLFVDIPGAGVQLQPNAQAKPCTLCFLCKGLRAATGLGVIVCVDFS